MSSSFFKVSTFLLLVLVLASAGIPEELCELDGSCDVRGTSVLQLSNKQSSLASDVSPHTYIGSHSFRPALDYFKWWSAGKVHQQLNRRVFQLTLEEGGLKLEPSIGKHTTWDASKLPEAHAINKMLDEYKGFCEQPAEFNLHDSSIGSDGVQHVLLRTPSGVIQYAAIHQGLVLTADPKHCIQSDLLQDLDAPTNPPLQDQTEDDGNQDPLHVKNDPLVQDCVELFHQVEKTNCNKEFNITVLSASVEIISGFRVFTYVKVTDPDGNVTYHDPQCDFEFPDHSFSSLLQQDPQTSDDPDHLIPTLRMNTSICSIDGSNSVSDDTSWFLHLMNKFSFGYLPRYKGYEHLTDKIPALLLPQLPQVGVPATAYDLRTVFPRCYPDSFREVIRDQGDCGSCWAFAAASATMSNLCASGQGNYVLKSSTDRMEVSVQGILSCNAAGDGCDGGNEDGAASAFQSAGIGSDDAFPYKCGGGNPLNHFDKSQQSCSSAPWGASCSSMQKQQRWFFDGLGRTKGEADIINGFLLGAAQSMSLDVYNNFMSYKGGVYTALSGNLLGGHAVAGLGYGVDKGVKYWIVQNSWGLSWGENGYARVQRGINLGGIDATAVIMRAYVDGGLMLACYDGADAGVSSSSGPLSCQAASRWCSNPSFGATITANCPVTCKATGCDNTRRSATGYVTTGSAPAAPAAPGATTVTTTAVTKTIAKTTTTTTTTTTTKTTTTTTVKPKCQDSSNSGVSTSRGQIVPCSQLKSYCADPRFGGTVSFNCPLTCQAWPCVCKDFADTQLSDNKGKLTCSDIKTRGYCSQDVARNRCPSTCGLCR